MIKWLEKLTERIAQKKIDKLEAETRKMFKIQYPRFVEHVEGITSKMENQRKEMRETKCPFLENPEQECKACRHYFDGKLKYELPSLKKVDFCCLNHLGFWGGLCYIFFTKQRLQINRFYEGDWEYELPKCKLWK